jgi:hypothetical protein
MEVPIGMGLMGRSWIRRVLSSMNMAIEFMIKD